ncbi:MAG: acyloxyacyl hydrolase [Bacteroidales bacterium]|nr:acyloxyacyl hydrolase [Bacteroidales bacterium]
MSVFFVGMLFAGNSHAQKFKKSDYFIEGGLRYGSALYHPKSDIFLKDLFFGSLELRFGLQAIGKNLWERSLNKPIVGIALRYTDYSDFSDASAIRKWQSRILGQNVALFGYLQGPIIRYKWFTWHYQLGMGFAVFTKIYNEKTNPENNLISLYVTPYINIQMGFDFRLNKKFELCLNANFVHSSNASMNMPNFGINEVQGIVGLRYHFNPDIQWIKEDAKPEFKPENALFFTIDPGWLWARYDDFYYLKVGTNIGYMRHLYPIFNVGIALDLCYMYKIAPTRDAKDANGQTIPTDYPTHSHAEALYAFGELTFGWFAFHVGIGGYFNRYPRNKELAKNRDGGGTLKKVPWIYEKIGFRIAIDKQQRHFVGVSIRAHFPVADYLAFTYGYKFYTFSDIKRNKKEAFSRNRSR